MQVRKDRVGSRSLASLGMVMVIVQVYHPSVLLMIQDGQTAAWLLGLLSGVLSAVVLWLTGRVLESIPGTTMADLAMRGFGRWFGPIAGILMAGNAVVLNGIMLRETAEMTISAVFPHTPQTFVMVALLLGAVYMAWGDAIGLARLGRIFLPVLLFSIALVIAGAIGWGETHYLEPLLGPGLPGLLTGLPRGAALFSPNFTIYLMTDRLVSTRGLANWVAGGALASGLVYGLSILTVLMAFPYPGGLDITMPLHGAARLVLGGRFFERLEGVWVMAWVMSTTLLLGVLIYAGARGFIQSFGIPRHRPVVPLLASLTLTVALFPHDQAATVLLLQTFAPILFLMIHVGFLTFAGLAAFRSRRQRS